jgi:tetratricopeptide (TPR) repeat protein
LVSDIVICHYNGFQAWANGANMPIDIRLLYDYDRLAQDTCERITNLGKWLHLNAHRQRLSILILWMALGLFALGGGGVDLFAQEATSEPAPEATTAPAPDDSETDSDIDSEATGLQCATDALAFTFHMERGALLRGRGNPDEALLHYNCAVSINPDAYLAYRSRAIVRTAIGQYMSALADLDRSIELNPDDPIAYNNRANTLIRIGRFGDAIVALNRALAIDPENATAYNNRGLVYANLGDNESAIADYTRAIEIGHEPPYFPYVNLGNLYREQGQYRQALVQFERAIVEDPFYADGYKLVGDMHLELGNIDEAERNYLQYVDLTNNASEEVLGYVEAAQIRELVQRYLPSLFVILIVLYFIGDAFLRWRRNRKASQAIPTTSSAMTPQGQSPVVTVSTSPMPDAIPTTSASNNMPANQRQPRWAWLIVPVIAGLALLFRGERDETKST